VIIDVYTGTEIFEKGVSQAQKVLDTVEWEGA
jgi:hypothetical protein